MEAPLPTVTIPIRALYCSQRTPVPELTLIPKEHLPGCAALSGRGRERVRFSQSVSEFCLPHSPLGRSAMDSCGSSRRSSASTAESSPSSAKDVIDDDWFDEVDTCGLEDEQVRVNYDKISWSIILLWQGWGSTYRRHSLFLYLFLNLDVLTKDTGHTAPLCTCILS